MIAYRNDIDSLRAVAVIAVIIFHWGFLPNGYLGVDVFFVISGYLITSIIYKDLQENSFSLFRFYERRIRRIMPLLFFITSAALLMGIYTMLPDDLENLAQSVFASNLSLNNVLMMITSSDYWAVKNEYKPLMHTWSLGIEEQFYLVYPLLLLSISKLRKNYTLPFLITATVISAVLFLLCEDQASRFYLLQYRFYELSMGGVFSIVSWKNAIRIKFANEIFTAAFSGLILCLFISVDDNRLSLLSITIFSSFVLLTGGQASTFYHKFLSNKFVIFIGKISFSLYLWHQWVFAFSRYTYYEKIGPLAGGILIAIIFALSAFTYYFIERPFRDQNIFSKRFSFLIIGLFFTASSTIAFYIYSIGGVYKDFPSVGTYKANRVGQNSVFSHENNIHIYYNESVRKLDKAFINDSTFNILIIGNSFGRDVVNIFQEHRLNEIFVISYVDINKLTDSSDFHHRWKMSDVIVFAAGPVHESILSKDRILNLGKRYDLAVDFNKIYIFGTKNYGYNNGIHYNRAHLIEDFQYYYTKMKAGTMDRENQLKMEWKEKYVSLIMPIANSNNEIRVFDEQGHFISHDTEHLSPHGAKLYSRILDSVILEIISNSTISN